MIPQLPLALRWPRRQRFEHFHAGANAAALAAVQALALQPAAPWVYLARRCRQRQSHLLMAACHAASAAGRTRAIPAAGHSRRSCRRDARRCRQRLLALDDLQAIAGNREAEHALFDLYNRPGPKAPRCCSPPMPPPTQLGSGCPTCARDSVPAPSSR